MYEVRGDQNETCTGQSFSIPPFRIYIWRWTLFQDIWRWTLFQEHLVTEKKTHHQQSINQLKVKKKCKSDNEVERHLICRHKQQQPYTQLVHLKFELTNQDSTGSQASLLTGDGNEYSQKGIYYSTNLVSETLNKKPEKLIYFLKA